MNWTRWNGSDTCLCDITATVAVAVAVAVAVVVSFFFVFFLISNTQTITILYQKGIRVLSISVTIIPTRFQLCQMQTNSPAGVKFLRYIFKFRKSKKLSSLLVHVLKTRHFHVVVVQWRQRNVKVCCTCRVVFYQSNPMAFWRSRCHHRRGTLNSLFPRSTCTTWVWNLF